MSEIFEPALVVAQQTLERFQSETQDIEGDFSKKAVNNNVISGVENFLQLTRRGQVKV